jgi:hypothetical protein
MTALFEFALQTTVGFCGLPVFLLACLTTLVVILIRRRRGEMLTLVRVGAYFVVVVSLCFVLTLAANWFFLLVRVENTLW